MTAPADEKAAPFPAEVSATALGALRCAIADKRTGMAIKMTIGGPAASAFHDAIARAIMQDRADRQEERIREDERLRFEGDLDRWMKTLGAGITGYQPEAYAVMDAACAELVRARARIADQASQEERIREDLERLEKAATEVSRLGAVTGPQWSRLSVALGRARARLRGGAS